MTAPPDQYQPDAQAREFPQLRQSLSQLTLLATVLLQLAYALPTHAAEQLAGTRPNIILVMTDDQGYAPVGRHGHPWVQTPNLDALYDSSTRFTRFMVSPTCAPTRSAIMTGRHPLKNGVTHTIFERERMTLDAVTLPQVLQQAGYQTGIFGKWHLGDEAPYQPDQRGFDETFIHGAGGIGQAYDCSCADVPNNTYFDPVVRHNGQFVKTQGFCTDIFFTAALSWIQQHSQTESAPPFLAYISTNAPHSPFVAPPKNTQPFREMGLREEQAGFYGMIENIDHNMGRLITRLEELKLLDNTLLIFMSDNGMTGGGSGDPNQPLGTSPTGQPMEFYNAHMKGLKNSVDEGGVRVPFFIRWDGHIAANQDIDTLAAHIDIFPTLASLASAAIPEQQVAGRNLLPLLENPAAAWDDRYVFTHQGRWPTGSEPNDYQWKNFSVRNQRYRLVDNHALYDMHTDPSQTQNIIEQHPKIVADMRSAYDQFWQAARPMMVNEAAPMSATRPYHELYQQQLQTTGIPSWTP